VRPVCRVKRNQEHHSYDRNRDQDVCEVIAKLDFPRNPTTTSNIEQNVDGHDRSEYQSEVFGIPPPETEEEDCQCGKGQSSS